MSELTYNLSQIYNCKLAIKAAIGTQSDELADYAGYITALKPDGYTYINENGDYDVAGYEYAYVNVPTGGGSGDSEVFIATLYDGAVQNLDGMNNIVYMQYGASDPVPAYAITTQVFTQEYPTSGYLYLLPDTLGISKDDNVNAYLFEPTTLAQRDFSYANVTSIIEEIDANMDYHISSTNDLMKARVTFRYNPNAIKVSCSTNGVTRPGPWGADGINTIMEPHAAAGIYGLSERLSNTQELYTITLSSDINLNNFGSYVLIPTKDIMSKSQYKYTASNAYATIYQSNYLQADEMYVMDMLNHKTYDCVLQRTSYKGGFTANKYETVLVDTYNYVGELQQTEIKGVRYGTGLYGFSFDSSSNTYNYHMSIPANGQIQARTTYFELTTDGSTWNKFNFCEDMISATSQDYVTFKLGYHGSGGNTTYTLLPSSISNYANIPTKLPSNYFRNGQNDSLDITIKIDKDTWKVNYEFHPKEGIYMKLYDSRGQYEYIQYDSIINETEYNFVYDKTKGSGYTFVFVKFDNNAIIRYGSHLDSGNINIWEYNDSAKCPMYWGDTEPVERFNYPTQSDVNDDGNIVVVNDMNAGTAWMKDMNSESESESES